MTEKKAEKPFAVSSHDIHLDSDYIQWIHSVKERFRNTQIKTAVKINYEQLYFNWQMGVRSGGTAHGRKMGKRDCGTDQP